MMRVIAVSAIAIVFCMSALADCKADPSPVLPGSDQNVSDAIASSDLIFLGRTVHLGPPAPTAPSQATYPCIFNVLNGTMKGRLVDKELTVFVTVRSVNPVHETAPEVGRSYIVFVKTHGKQKSAVKLLNANEKNINDIRRALGLEKAGK
jgi:hypothetical protein